MVLWQRDDERHCVIRVKSVAVVNFMDIQLIGNCWLLLKLYGGLMWCDLPSELTHGNQFAVPFKIDDDRRMLYILYTFTMQRLLCRLFYTCTRTAATAPIQQTIIIIITRFICFIFLNGVIDALTWVPHNIIKISSDWIRQLELIVDLFA